MIVDPPWGRMVCSIAIDWRYLLLSGVGFEPPSIFISTLATGKLGQCHCGTANIFCQVACQADSNLCVNVRTIWWWNLDPHIGAMLKVVNATILCGQNVVIFVDSACITFQLAILMKSREQEIFVLDELVLGSSQLCG
jgi:hypothetical protein